MVENTLYRSEESARKQLKMEKWVYKYLSQEEEESMTKGLVAYECLLYEFDNYEDDLTKQVEFAEERLSELTSSEFVESVKKIKSEKDKHELMEQASEYDSDIDDVMDNVNIHIPAQLNEQLLVQRGVGDHIGEAVLSLIQSPFDDRMDYLNCLTELIRHVQDQRITVDHTVADAIVSQSELSGYDMDESIDLIKKYIDEWWHDDDVDVDTLISYGSEIKNKYERIETLERALINSDESYTNDEIKDIIVESFNVTSESTIDNYISMIDIGSVNPDRVYVDISNYGNMDVFTSSLLDHYDDWMDVIDLNMDENGGYMDVWDAINYIESVEDNIPTSSAYTGRRMDCITKVKEQMYSDRKSIALFINNQTDQIDAVCVEK